MLLDLTHTFENGMPGFTMRGQDGRTVRLTASIRPFLTHKDSRPLYEGKASFEITEMSFHTSTAAMPIRAFAEVPAAAGLSPCSGSKTL